MQFLNEPDARRKKEALFQALKDLGSLLVAFSGGVDSTFLLSVAYEALAENVLAATAASVIQAPRETREAIRFAREEGIRHIVFPSEEMSLEEFMANEKDRCYHCKRRLFKHLFEIAREQGISHVAHAANMDDMSDYRPGLKAAQEAGALAPLMDAELGKEEIRFLARQLGLFNWDKPAMACLASRIPYGTPISEHKLRMIDEAEVFLQSQGLREVRVRHHGTVARVEVGEGELEEIWHKGLRKKIVQGLRKIGFEHVALDLEGYIQGKMNRGLDETPNDLGPRLI